MPQAGFTSISTGSSGRRRIKAPAPLRPASPWVWVLGALCLACATIFFPLGLTSYLTPFLGKGPSLVEFAPAPAQAEQSETEETQPPAETGAPPWLVRVLLGTVLLVQGIACIFLGAAGAIILHRAWNPGVVWKARDDDPPWFQKFVERYNWLSRRAVKLAWRGTYLSFLLAVLGLAYMHFGEQMRLPFAVDPDISKFPHIYNVVLFVWPLALLVLSNIYRVKRHFLPERVEVDHLIRPPDVIDLMAPKDVQIETKKAPKEDLAEESSKTYRRYALPFLLGGALGALAGLILWYVVENTGHFFMGEPGSAGHLGWWTILGFLFLGANALPGADEWRTRFLRFSLLRTCALRHRTVEIGQTDVHSRWWSQQFLRGYRWGPDHRFSESQAWSFSVHAAVIFGPIVLAFLASFLGCMDPYKIPLGGGDRPKGGPQKKQKQVKVKKIKKKYLVNPYSSIVFAMIDPKQMDLKLDEDTEHNWTGQVGPGGGRGGGRGGMGKPGYGGGIGGGVVRFLRLQHNGPDWNRNMTLDGDFQMLAEFRKRTEIPVASKTEAVTIEQLANFPKKFTPPFIYVTGRKYFSISSRDARILKDYLLKRGGFILGDSPGEYFQQCFRSMIGHVLGGQARWIDIPDDDEIYTCYYMLPSGAPPLWHHDGYRGQGIKIDGRWVVFYHPGDLGDAWRVGHSGAAPDAVEAAYQMGVNAMHYAFTHYIDFHRGKF